MGRGKREEKKKQGTNLGCCRFPLKDRGVEIQQLSRSSGLEEHRLTRMRL